VSIDHLNPVGIADLLVSLVSNPNFSLTIARNGYKRVHCLRWKVAADQLEGFNFELLNHLRVQRAF